MNIYRRWRQTGLLPNTQGKNSVIRTDTDQINQQRIARDNPQLKTAPIARKARVSTAINNEAALRLGIRKERFDLEAAQVGLDVQ